MDNQSKWKRLGYKGDTGQPIKKTDTLSPANDLSSARKIGEIRRTSDSDLNRSVAEKANVINTVGSRLTEVNGIRKDLVSQEKRRRSSLIDEKDLNLTGLIDFYMKFLKNGQFLVFIYLRIKIFFSFRISKRRGSIFSQSENSI